ncbi:Gfo/Idh/MocA family oxidoreductase [candidate division KSB1 bacterium]|nr:Gfo/Idh/MocA family oxidoreductase [candidate division KSB1 bacterium]
MKRRDFLKKSMIGSAALSIPTILPSSVLGRDGHTPPSDQIVMGLIGVGSMGSGHLQSFLGHEDVHIAAICDVRKAHRDAAKKRVDQKYGNSDCDTYNDFREMLARQDIDACTVVVPDNWHVLIGLEAARQGKHMYYEKPLALSIEEAKAIRKAVHRHGVVFQFGTQQRSDDRFRFTCELVRNGRLGDMKHIMIGSASYDQIPMPVKQPVPEGFDYDRWLGPAPWAPHAAERCTRQWTLIADYSLGCLSGAWGIHHVDIAQWAFNKDLSAPEQIEGWGKTPVQGLYDTAQHWEVEHLYADGKKLVHMDAHTAKERAWQFGLQWMGMLFEGSDGWIYVARGFIESEPKSLLKTKFCPSDIRLPVSGDHRRNFLDAVKSGKSTMCPVDVAFGSDITCHQAHIAMKLGRRLKWNPVKEEFINDTEANKMMHRPMRSPWHL